MNDIYEYHGIKDTEKRKIMAMCDILPVVADIAHAQVSIYLNSLNDRHLLVLAQAKPQTAFIYYRNLETGVSIPYVDDQLVTHVFETGLTVSGKREWLSTDMSTSLALYPWKYQGRVLAVLVFEYLDTKQCYPKREKFLQAAISMLDAAEWLQTEGLVDRFNTADGIMLVDNSGEIQGLNNIMQNIYLSLGLDNILGRKIFDRQLHLEGLLAFYNKSISYNCEIEVAGRIWQQRLLIIKTGKILNCCVIAINDVTEIKEKDQQLMVKSAVIQEIHHRVKNNLQTVASLLRIRARHSKNEEVKSALKESIDQIVSISVVHEFLSVSKENVINVQIIAKTILDLLVKDIQNSSLNIDYEFVGEDVWLSSARANSVAIIVNELVQNTIKHAFVGREQGRVSMSVRGVDKDCLLVIGDNGIGLPENFSIDKMSNTGLQIINTLITYDLKGKFSLEKSSNGTIAVVSIPIDYS